MNPDEAADQLPPFDEAAEYSVLACAVERPELLAQIRPDLFYDDGARLCAAELQAMRAAGHTINAHSINEAVRHRNPMVAAQLVETMNKLPTSINFTFWLEAVVETWKRRQQIQIGFEMAEAGRDGDEERVRQLERRLADLNRVGAAGVGRSAGELIPEAIDELEEMQQGGGRPTGVSTGFARLDRTTHGLERKRLYVVGGKTGSGKSVLLANLAAAAAQAGVRVLFLSLEMPAGEIMGRLIAADSRVSRERFHEGHVTEGEFARTVAAAGRIRRWPLWIADNRFSLSDIIGSATKSVSEHGSGLVIIDYLQLIRIPNFKGNRNELMTEVSNEVKRLAMSLDVPVVVAAQFSRLHEREGRQPGLADLRESGSIEQAGDVAILINGGDPYDQRPNVEFLIPKGRSLLCGRLSYTFIKDESRFIEVSPADGVDQPPAPEGETDHPPAPETSLPYADE